MTAKAPTFKKLFRNLISSPILRLGCILMGIKPRRLYYDSIGIALGHQLNKSGEAWFVQKKLPELIKSSRPVIFDVGANVGDFTDLLQKSFPQARIFAFEPGPETFSILSSVKRRNVTYQPIALGSRACTAYLFDENDGDGAGASLVAGVYAKKTKKKRFKVIVKTLDGFATEQKIKTIDFLKVDVEGFELEVIKGAMKKIRAGLIPVVLFEFNEMNIAARVFLKDFYTLFGGYKFYRLHRRKLIPLGAYHIKNEIFEYQNIVVIREDLLDNLPQ